MKNLLFLLGWLCANLTAAQSIVHGQPLLSWDNFVEEYLESLGIDDDAPSPLNRGGTTLDLLQEQMRQPLNLNTASRDELLQLSLLTAPQVDSLLSYRTQLRAFTSPSDLMMVHGLYAQQRRWLSLFTYVGDTLRTPQPWWDELRHAQHALELRAQLPLPRAQQFNVIPTQKHADWHRFLGTPWSTTLRYRLRARNTWRAGLTLDQDVGEPWGSYRNYPCDFTSFFVEHRSSSAQRTLLLGDFHAQIGQGLLIGHRFGSFTQAYFLDLPHNTHRFTPNTSTSEAHYLRGIAWQQRHKRWQWLAFASYRALDAHIVAGQVQATYNNGLHRNLIELSHRSTLINTTLGAHLQWSNQRTQWGITSLAQQFSHPFPSATNNPRGIPSPMVGKSIVGISSDFAHYARHWSAQGELAIDHRGGMAFSSFARWQPSESDVWIAQLRHFTPHYIAPLAQTFQQSSHVQNETGLLLGYETSRWRKIISQSFLQIAHHPLPTWRAAAPSSAVVFQSQWQYAPRPSQQWSVRYRLSAAQQTISGHAPLLQWQDRHNFRLQFTWMLPQLTWQTALHLSWAHQQWRNQQHQGWMLSSRASYTPARAWKIAAFLSYFSIPHFAARIYAYQPQLPGVGAFPSFYGKGLSSVWVAIWQPSPAWSLSLRGNFMWRKYTPSSRPTFSAADPNLPNTTWGIRLLHLF